MKGAGKIWKKNAQEWDVQKPYGIKKGLSNKFSDCGH